MKIPLKIILTHLLFYKRNPFKFFEKKNKPRNLVSKIPSRTDKLETIFKKIIPVVIFLKKIRRPPTCPKFNTHKKVVVHFFIPILLLPKTPPLTYSNMKRFKGSKMDSLSLFTFHFSLSLSLSSIINFCRVVPRTSLSTSTWVGGR